MLLCLRYFVNDIYNCEERKQFCSLLLRDSLVTKFIVVGKGKSVVLQHCLFVKASWNVMTHAQKPDFVFRLKGRVHLNRLGALVQSTTGASAVVMLDSPCSEVVWRVLATHSLRQFPLHFPSRASPCAITFQLDSTTGLMLSWHILSRDHITLLDGNNK
jgi:hypothetical protein